VWFVVGEHPGTAALVGGGIVLLVLTVHSLSGLRADKQSS